MVSKAYLWGGGLLFGLLAAVAVFQDGCSRRIERLQQEAAVHKGVADAKAEEARAADTKAAVADGNYQRTKVRVAELEQELAKLHQRVRRRPMVVDSESVPGPSVVEWDPNAGEGDVVRELESVVRKQDELIVAQRSTIEAADIEIAALKAANTHWKTVAEEQEKRAVALDMALKTSRGKSLSRFEKIAWGLVGVGVGALSNKLN